VVVFLFFFYKKSCFFWGPTLGGWCLVFFFFGFFCFVLPFFFFVVFFFFFFFFFFWFFFCLVFFFFFSLFFFFSEFPQAKLRDLKSVTSFFRCPLESRPPQQIETKHCFVYPLVFCPNYKALGHLLLYDFGPSILECPLTFSPSPFSPLQAMAAWAQRTLPFDLLRVPVLLLVRRTSRDACAASVAARDRFFFLLSSSPLQFQMTLYCA